MRLRLDQMTSTPSGLVMGVQIRGPKDSWIRFAVLEVPWESVPRYVMDDYYRWEDRVSKDEDQGSQMMLEFGEYPVSRP